MDHLRCGLRARSRARVIALAAGVSLLVCRLGLAQVPELAPSLFIAPINDEMTLHSSSVSAASSASSSHGLIEALTSPLHHNPSRDVQLSASTASTDPIALDHFRLDAELRSDDSLSIEGSGLVPGRPSTLLARAWKDELNFYAPESLVMIGGGLAGGAILANTSLDPQLQSHFQSSLHHANSDDWLESLHANKELGDGRFTLPCFAGVWAFGSLLPESPVGDNTRMWGERSLRAFVVGAPSVLLLQKMTGGSRPGETMHSSEWEPFRDNNGVSGHAFMGALPFITAAKMTDSIGLKTTFYAASLAAPLSRTADGAHYPSQVMLGWWLAYVAASAVHATDDPTARWHVMPLITSNGSGVGLEYRY